MSESKKMPAKKKTTRRNTKKEQQKKAATRKMIAFFVGLLLILFALARLGIVGVLLYNIVRLFVGSLAIVFLLLLAGLMIISVFRKQVLKENKRIIPAIILTFIGLIFVFQIRLHQGFNETFHLIWSDLMAGRVIHFVGSGVIGALITEPAKALFSVIGVYIIAAVLWLVAIYLMIPGLFPKMREDLHQRLAKWKEKHAEKVEAKKAAKALAELEKKQAVAEREELPEAAENSLFTSAPTEIPINIPEAPFEENETESPVLAEVPLDDEPVNFSNTNNYNGNYKLPTIDLLAEVPVKNQSGERENVRKNIGILEETFKSFGIGANVESAVVGPSITKYEIKLATGTKVSRVVNLSDDLALALAAKDIRIEAPIPGKSLVGVEIPNAEVAMVGFREMWEAGKTNPSKLLEIPLGKSLDGGIRTFDLTRMPHLLVAGSTGSGKSVAVNGIITSILMKALPSQVKFLMVDPKMVELSVYNDIPHLLIPVVTNPRKASRALQKVVDQMEERYELFSRYGVRNIAGYNEKVQRYNAESDDLALALAAKDIRIEAPIPGKSLVGVEIPNAEVAMVGFREMWEAGKTNPSKLLEIPLGKSLDGGIRTFDLTRMPHLLVAGSTGSGKSVAVNGIITSILMKALPSQVKFLMVDPKMVELSVYNDIPHLLIPVVTNPRKASRALQKVVDQMEERYELFSRYGVRNIAGYNEKVQRYNAESDEKMLELPLIVVIVDELADLMMVASKEVEDAIIRLGQKARAAGIHMILATQRPSVDVISGLIKANVPSRIAFAVSSGTDSRTILDTNGAEKLLGRGDMLFKPIDENHPIRLQGAFLSDDDVESVVTFIKDQSEAQYDESFDPGEVDESQVGTGASNTGSGDPLFEEARNMVIMAQKASTAQLQRALKVGFNRASDLMNELEAQGIVGPAKGTTPRKVLVSPDGEFIGGVEE